MIVIKEMPGLTPREILEALLDITGPDGPPVATGHGGFVVDEDVAEQFLRAYLVLTGKRPAMADSEIRTETGTTRATLRDGTRAGSGAARATTRRAGREKEAS